MNGNANEKRQALAEWIKCGWQNRKDEAMLGHRYLTLENHRYTIYLYTLKFALAGMGDFNKKKAALRAKVRNASDPFEATAKFFGVSKDVLKDIVYLEGPYERKRPVEIAAILEQGGPNSVQPQRRPSVRGIARKR